MAFYSRKITGRRDGVSKSFLSGKWTARVDQVIQRPRSEYRIDDSGNSRCRPCDWHQIFWFKNEAPTKLSLSSGEYLRHHLLLNFLIGTFRPAAPRDSHWQPFGQHYVTLADGLCSYIKSPRPPTKSLIQREWEPVTPYQWRYLLLWFIALLRTTHPAHSTEEPLSWLMNDPTN